MEWWFDGECVGDFCLTSGISILSSLKLFIFLVSEESDSLLTTGSFDRLKSSGCSDFDCGMLSDEDGLSCLGFGEKWCGNSYTGTGTFNLGSDIRMGNSLCSALVFPKLSSRLRSLLSGTLSQSELWLTSDSPSLVVLSWIIRIFFLNGWLSSNRPSLFNKACLSFNDWRNCKSSDPGIGGVGRYFSASNEFPNGNGFKLSLICGRKGNAGLPPNIRMYSPGLNIEAGGVIPKVGNFVLISFWRFNGIPFLSAPSQNRLCLLSDVIVEKACPQSVHLICCRQSACIRLCRQRLENCVYAFKHTSHWKGFTLLWMWRCCFRPLDVANVLPQSGHAWLLAPICWDRMWRCKFEGSVNVFSQCSHENRLEFSVATWR